VNTRTPWIRSRGAAVLFEISFGTSAVRTQAPDRPHATTRTELSRGVLKSSYLTFGRDNRGVL